MTIQEYRAKRAKHIERIKMLRTFDLSTANMIENEQWILAMTRTKFYHPERVDIVMGMVDRFVFDKLLSTHEA